MKPDGESDALTAATVSAATPRKRRKPRLIKLRRMARVGVQQLQTAQPQIQPVQQAQHHSNIARVALDTSIADAANNEATVYGTMELTLNEQGMICGCNSEFNWLGYRRSDLVWRHISVLLPKLADIKLMCGKQINPRLRFLFRVGCDFQLVSFGGKQFEGKLFINEVEDRGRHYLRAIVIPVKEWVHAQTIMN